MKKLNKNYDIINIDNLYENITKSAKIAYKNLQKKESKNKLKTKVWYSKKLIEFMKQRIKENEKNNKEKKKIIKKLNRKIKRRRTADWKIYVNKITKKMEEAQNKGNTKKLFTLLKKITTYKKVKKTQIEKNKDGNRFKNDNELSDLCV